MDQRFVSGLGNIYVNEVLFMSRIHPLKPCNDLRKQEIKKLIKDSIPDASIEIKDLMGDNNHYAAAIKSSQFNNISKIEQHKLVYKSLKGKMGNELHALSITTEGK